MESHELEPAIKLNPWILAAAALMTLTVFVHVFAGGPEVLATVRASSLAPVVIAVVSVVWHAVTVMLAVIATALFWLSRHKCPPLVAAINAVQVGFVVLFIGYGISDLGTLIPVMQWTIFLMIPLLTWIGVARDKRAIA